MRDEQARTARHDTVRRRSRAVAVAAIAASALVYAAYAPRFPLSEPDEARYAEMSREMLETGDWITPRLNYQPFLDKPPLLYWLGAAAFGAFGVSPAVARIPAALPALGGLAATYALAASAYGAAAGALAVVILATAPLYFGMAQILTMDMPLAFCVTLGLLGVWRGFQRRDRRWYRLAHGAVGLGILAKGPIAALLVGAPAVFLLARHGRRSDWRRALDPLGVLLAAIVALPWFCAVEARNPGFTSEFLVHHHLQRFFAPWEHREPPWFYAYVLPVSLFPWSLLWLLDARALGVRSPRRWTPATQFLVAAAATAVVVFSASRSKLIPYVLPALPPLAILLGRAYDAILSADCGRWLRRCATALTAAGAAFLVASGSVVQWVQQARAVPLVPHLLAGGMLLFCTAGAVRHLGRRSARFALGALAAGTLGLLLVAEHGRVLARDYGSLGAAAAARPGSELLVYGGYVPSLGFYARRPATIFGKDDAESLARLWDASPEAMLVASRQSLDSLGAIAADHIVIAEQNGKVLVARASSPDESALRVARRTRDERADR